MVAEIDRKPNNQDYALGALQKDNAKEIIERFKLYKNTRSPLEDGQRWQANQVVTSVEGIPDIAAPENQRFIISRRDMCLHVTGFCRVNGRSYWTALGWTKMDIYPKPETNHNGHFKKHL